MALSKIEADSLDIGQVGGRRNLIINGAMQVAQRGTSHQVTTAQGGYFTCDRWRYTQYNGYAADVNITMSQDTDTPNQTFKNSFKALVGTGSPITSGDSIVIEQIIEGQDIVQLAQGSSDAKNFTISFYVKASATGTYCISLHSGKSFDSNRSHVKEYTISSANTWEYKTITVNGDTSGTWANDNNAGLSLAFILSCGSTYQGAKDTWSDNDYFATSNQTQLTETTNATFQITGVQLEVGSVATPFEHRSYGEELALCQRYYQVVGYYDTVGTTGTNTMFYVSKPLTVAMRASPSLEADYAIGTLTGRGYTRVGSTTYDGFVFVNSTPTMVAVKGATANIFNTIYGDSHWSAEL